MADNMTIGPVLAIGGNQVQMTQKGKIQVTNPKGKIKTLTQDEFKKQLIKNADKIEAGQDFEFKKDHTTAKVVGGVAGVLALAYAGLGLAVGKGKLTKAVAEAGKELGFMGKVKNVFVAIGQSAVDAWKYITKSAKKIADKITGKSEKKEPPVIGEKYIREANRDYIKTKGYETINFTPAERAAVKGDAKSAFSAKNFVEFAEADAEAYTKNPNFVTRESLK